jgi:hypothetical protein
MFCTGCGKELRAGAKFCAYCGASVPEVELHTLSITVSADDQLMGIKYNDSEEAVFEGWTLSNDLFEVNPVELKMPWNMLKGMISGEISFVCLTPAEMIEGSRFVQAAMCEDGTIHFEVCMDKQGGYEILSRDGLDLTTAVQWMTSYLALKQIPQEMIDSQQ